MASSEHDRDSAASVVTGRDRLEALVRPFGGRVHCHSPADRPFSYAALARTDDGRDRWGGPGLRSVYLASDPAVAIAEYARHRDPAAPADRRRICAFRLGAVRLLDVRDDEAAQVLGVPLGPTAFLDRERARRIGRAIRAAGLCQGLIVPSMAFLERPERFNIVLFVEQLDVDLERLLTDPEVVGEIRLDA